MSLLDMIASGNRTAIFRLLDQGADPNEPDSNGSISLHYTDHNYQIDIVKRLLQKGAKVNTQNIHGNTPLHFSASSGQNEIVQFY